MADDSWHHLEGTYPRGGPFRVFFYDDYTRPMPVKGFSGSVVLLDANEKELDSFPLKPGRITNALEAPIKGATLPLKVKLKVRFERREKNGPSTSRSLKTRRSPRPSATPVVTTSARGAAPDPGKTGDNCGRLSRDDDSGPRRLRRLRRQRPSRRLRRLWAPHPRWPPRR